MTSIYLAKDNMRKRIMNRYKSSPQAARILHAPQVWSMQRWVIPHMCNFDTWEQGSTHAMSWSQLSTMTAVLSIRLLLCTE